MNAKTIREFKSDILAALPDSVIDHGADYASRAGNWISTPLHALERELNEEYRRRQREKKTARVGRDPRNPR